ncbi:hypothetical protein EW026_g900 [Hermanssonia centrifuga]|uniref:Uncharacterized protein n=1 Tax=Hermanssonia centrifuga TaxID=98765 RepID=A0A4S4KT58_9APHY|nr:hypothetical protein EW026_g900 [Hermanssonia centrifuga]
MRRTGPPRLNRLPQRLDYTLIPAPLDEKAALPAIIVTPSSPSGETDFAIAFLAPPQKPTLRERVSSVLPRIPKLPSFHRRLPSEIQLPVSPYKKEFATSSAWSFKARASSSILLAILLFIMGCHLLMHSLVTSRPRLDFGPMGDDDAVIVTMGNGPLDSFGAVPHNNADSATPSIGGWFNLHAMWAPMPITDGKRSARFIITEVDTEES